MGAILSLVVAANIMAINYSFDVCVKLLSTVLVVMAIYLLAQGWEHHFNFFFLNRDVRPESLTKPVFRRRWINLTLLIAKYAVIAWLFFGGLYEGNKAMAEYGPDAPKPPLYGVYNVQKDGLLLTGRWQGDSIRVTLKKFNLDNLLLVNRGFHFIN